MTRRGLLTTGDLDAIDAAVRAMVDEAVAVAEAAPLPEPADLHTDVYVPERGDSGLSLAKGAST